MARPTHTFMLPLHWPITRPRATSGRTRALAAGPQNDRPHYAMCPLRRALQGLALQVADC